MRDWACLTGPGFELAGDDLPHFADGGLGPRNIVRHTACWRSSSNTNLRLRPTTSRVAQKVQNYTTLNLTHSAKARGALNKKWLPS